jgi:sugar O-acyltransferase (sialic acid O-acetyltransferase NeuD family)
MSSKRKIIVYGSSYPDAIESIIKDGEVEILGIVDDIAEHNSEVFLKIPLLGNRKVLANFADDIPVLNNIWSHNNRMNIYKIIKESSLPLLSYFARDVHLPNSLIVGEGNWMHRGVKVGSNVVIGDNCGFRFNSIINHDCKVGSHSFFGPGVVLSGRVKVGNNSFIGSGSVVLPNVEIGNNVVIGAGSVVTKSISDNQVVYGNPAKIKK